MESRARNPSAEMIRQHVKEEFQNFKPYWFPDDPRSKLQFFNNLSLSFPDEVSIPDSLMSFVNKDDFPKGDSNDLHHTQLYFKTTRRQFFGHVADIIERLGLQEKVREVKRLKEGMRMLEAANVDLAVVDQIAQV